MHKHVESSPLQGEDKGGGQKNNQIYFVDERLKGHHRILR
jgi:hypothetical protein